MRCAHHSIKAHVYRPILHISIRTSYMYNGSTGYLGALSHTRVHTPDHPSARTDHIQPQKQYTAPCHPYHQPGSEHGICMLIMASLGLGTCSPATHFPPPSGYTCVVCRSYTGKQLLTVHRGDHSRPGAMEGASERMQIMP